MGPVPLAVRLQGAHDVVAGASRHPGLPSGCSPTRLYGSVATTTRACRAQQALKAHFGWELNTRVNPDGAVAQGAAILGARLCGYLTDRIRLWDVTPLSSSLAPELGYRRRARSPSSSGATTNPSQTARRVRRRHLPKFELTYSIRQANALFAMAMSRVVVSGGLALTE